MSRRIWIPIVMSALLAPAWVNAQDQQQGQQGQERGERGGDRGGDRRGGDAAEFRQRMEERLREQLGTTEEEWKVLQPKLEKVMTARRDTMGGGFGFGGFGGRGPRGDDNNSSQQRSAVQTASAELRTTLENKDAAPEEINAKLKALRDAREKARADLAAAQKDLKEIITPRQEAVLVTMGMLE